MQTQNNLISSERLIWFMVESKRNLKQWFFKFCRCQKRTKIFPLTEIEQNKESNQQDTKNVAETRLEPFGSPEQTFWINRNVQLRILRFANGMVCIGIKVSSGIRIYKRKTSR